MPPGPGSPSWKTSCASIQHNGSISSTSGIRSPAEAFMSEVREADAASEVGLRQAAAAVRLLREILPPELVPLFGAAFVRSHYLYDEFVYRLVLQVARDMGFEAALREPRGEADLAVRSKLEPQRALVPLDWMLRLLAVRGLLDVKVEGGTARFRARAPFPALDAGT